MKFAFLIMSSHEIDSREERAAICDGEFSIISVNDIEDAKRTASELERKGIGCIELCGAFNEEGCRAVIEATGGRIPIGYVTHLAEQDGVFKKTFG